jgi:hypothetical protein
MVFAFLAQRVLGEEWERPELLLPLSAGSLMRIFVF